MLLHVVFDLLYPPQVSVTASDAMVELGRARTANHDLALELARVFRVSETLASDKEVGITSNNPAQW